MYCTPIRHPTYQVRAGACSAAACNSLVTSGGGSFCDISMGGTDGTAQDWDKSAFHRAAQRDQLVCKPGPNNESYCAIPSDPHNYLYAFGKSTVHTDTPAIVYFTKDKFPGRLELTNNPCEGDFASFQCATCPSSTTLAASPALEFALGDLY